MAELEAPGNKVPENEPTGGAGRSKDDVALELMKFIAVTTGYGKATQGSTGFSGKPATRSADEHAEALLELFNRCRKVVKEDS
jgi:hypothetical protein